MGYLVLAEAVILAVLWGAWRAQRNRAAAAEAALKALTEAVAARKATVDDEQARYEKEIAALRKELSAVYEAMDATANPSSTRDELNRLLAR